MRIPSIVDLIIGSFLARIDYNDTHRALQKFMRKFADEVVIPEAQAHEKSGKRPSTELIKKMGDLHINAMVRHILSVSTGLLADVVVVFAANGTRKASSRIDSSWRIPGREV